jgi:ribosomal protein S21
LKNFNPDRESSLRGSRVEVRNGDFAKALRKFKKKVADDGILQDIRKKEYFVSKGAQRRLDKLAAIRRYQKNKDKEIIS